MKANNKETLELNKMEKSGGSRGLCATKEISILDMLAQVKINTEVIHLFCFHTFNLLIFILWMHCRGINNMNWGYIIGHLTTNIFIFYHLSQYHAEKIYLINNCWFIAWYFIFQFKPGHLSMKVLYFFRLLIK